MVRALPPIAGQLEEGRNSMGIVGWVRESLER